MRIWLYIVRGEERMRHNNKILYDVPIKMRDRAVFYYEIYRPHDDRDYPAVVNRTPYLKDNINPLSGYIHAYKLASRGIIQL